MAIVKKRNFVEFSGKLGDYIYRRRYGKLVQYRCPVNHKVSRSIEAEDARNIFSLNIKFASFINEGALKSHLCRNNVLIAV